MSKQDRQGARTPAELERKYEFGQAFTQLQETSKQNSERISKQGQEMEQFISSSYGQFSSLEEGLNSADKVISVLKIGMSNLQTRMTNVENRYKELVKVADVSGMISTLNGISENLAVLNNRIGDMENVVYSAHGTVKEASGSVLYLDDTPECKLSGLVLYGRTTQDGTPSLDAPVPLNSAGGEGNIAVTVGERKAVFATPNGLPGLKVSSDGNYTDESGQQWVCDEIDFVRGKYVQRVKLGGMYDFYTKDSIILPSDSQWYNAETSNSYEMNWSFVDVSSGKVLGLCNVLPSYFFASFYGKGIVDGVMNGNRNMVINLDKARGIDTIDKFIAWCNEVDIKFLKHLTEPIETDLTAEQLAQYATLRTSYPSTSIYNSAGAGMKVTYTSRELT